MRDPKYDAPEFTEPALVTDSGYRIGDPCEAIEALFVYGPMTCMRTSVAVAVDAEWGTTHVVCAQHAPDVVTAETCDECAQPIDANDLAPSCGVHRLHLGCRAHFSCRWCDEEWKEANA